MWEMTRIWPIIIQFGVGGVLIAAGILAGVLGKYVDLKRREDRMLVTVMIGGYLLLLAGYVSLTVLAPLT